MFSRKLDRYLLGVFFMFMACKGWAEPSLQGIALHRELGQDQFLGALYTDIASDDVEVILDARIAKRMELKVVARSGIVAGRFSRMWIEGAAINNSIELLTEQADNMLIFDQMFRGRLEENDHIVIDYVPAEGVDVYMNSILLGSIASDNFFPLLLRSWIGRVPLSSRYRDELLSMDATDSELLQRYQHLEPRVSRIAVVQDWVAESTQEVLASEATVITSETENTEAELPAIPAKSVPENPVPIEPAAIVAVAAKPIASQTESRLSETPETQSPEKNSPQSVTHQESLADATPKAKAGSNSEEDEPVLTAQTLLAQQMYISTALQRIYTRVNYPRRAQQLRQAGSVKIRVVIRSNGDLKDLQLLEESDFSLLNHATLAAVKSAAPFPALPDTIAGRDIEFSVPVKFSLGSI